MTYRDTSLLAFVIWLNVNIILSFPLGVGKTSLLQRYTQNKFDPKNTTSTTGALFVTKKEYVDGIRVRLQLWDTAGQERFRSMVRPSTTPKCHSVSHLIFPSFPLGTYVLSERECCSTVVRYHERRDL